MSAIDASSLRGDARVCVAGEVARRLAAAGQATLLPDWPAPAHVGLLTTTRTDQASADGTIPEFVTGGDAGRIAARLADTRRSPAALQPLEPVWLDQVHGAGVIVLDTATLPAARAGAPVADAAVTRLPNVTCAVLTADCLPVAITDRHGTAIGIAHAGWRGLAAGVLEATVGALVEQGVAAADMIVWFGPAIGPGAFEVGADVMSAFCASDPGAATCFAPRGTGKWLADLYGLARRRLAAAGVHAIHGGGLCTYSDPLRFHSYRRDRTRGRMATLLWLGAARRSATL